MQKMELSTRFESYEDASVDTTYYFIKKLREKKVWSLQGLSLFSGDDPDIPTEDLNF